MSGESNNSSITNISQTTFNSSDLLAALKKIQDDGDRQAKDSTDFETIQNQNIIERILNVLDDGIEKLKITLIMPYLLEDPTELKNSLSISDLKKLYQYSESYCIYQKTKSNLIKTEFIDIDYEILKAVEIIDSNKKIRENLPIYLKNVPLEKMELIKAMEHNRKITEKRLRTSAVSEIATERLIHHIYHNNEKLKKQIKELKGVLDKKEINTRWKVLAKQGVIKKYQEDLAFKKWENSIKVKKVVVRANDEMATICTEYENEQQNLTTELNEMKETYNKILDRNLHEERELRKKKNSYIKTLQDLLQKFDTDMLAKIGQHEKLIEKKLEEQKKLDDFMVEFNAQEEEYQALYNAMLEEKNRAQREKMLMFMMNRAARTIQRYWRQFLKARKKKRGKSKGKGRGKKK